jgi:hypothetical protein
VSIRNYRDDIRRRILEKGIPKKRVAAETGVSRKTINKTAIEALGKSGKIRRSGRIVDAIDLGFQKCVKSM